MNLVNKREFILIYNAKGGKLNSTLDLIHKYMSPSTYKCNLCKVTFGITMKKKWKNFINSTQHSFTFLHKEDLKNNNLEKFKNNLPVCIEKRNENYFVMIDSNEMKKLMNEDDLINIFKDKL
jgi:hypothetical protein|tara:strand:+ start:2185 stop:2550 length:366 start_codon:yes stop_codon:yes gene_type:complete